MIDGDLTALLVDAIVSPDDGDGQMYSYLASTIKLQAGEEVEEESVDSGPLRPGSAWYTTAGALDHLKGIIHVAMTESDGKAEFDNEKLCVRSAYAEAKAKSLESFGVAAFGPGVRIESDEGVNIARWAPAMADEIVRCIKEDEATRIREDNAIESKPLAILLVVKGQRGHFDETVELVKEEVS